jgi:ornithine cyclodeaminase/alanine dehydrogenase-like protein (mu-crystallin family)
MLHKGMLGMPLESTAWDGRAYTQVADKFVCDDWNLCLDYLAAGKYTDGLPEEYQLLGKIINGEVSGRDSEDEFVISSSHGIAISDVAVADLVLKVAAEKGVGQMLTLMEEADILR